jgi:hypothetical protein
MVSTAKSEVYRIHPNPDSRDSAAEGRREVAAPKRIAIQ